MKTLMNRCLVIGLAVGVTACSSLTNPPRSEVEKTLDSSKVVIRHPPIIADAKTYSREFGLMALFAQTAYRDDLKPPSDRRGRGCEFQRKEDGYEKVVLKDMPASASGHWERWLAPGSCAEEGGMFLETYVHTRGTEFMGEKITPDMAVIAFRGTENDTVFEFQHDWGASLSGMATFMGKEYELARNHAMPLIAKLHGIKDESGRPIPIYLTGHSLGGGLAQSLAYIADGMITATYAFNTSPTTNWTHLREYEQQHDPVIYRVSERGEFLGYIREVTTKFTDDRYRRSELEFDFSHAGMFNKHSIKQMTCGLAKLSVEFGDGGRLRDPFDYSVSSARKILDSELCNPDKN